MTWPPRGATHLDNGHEPAIQLGLVGGVVRDGPARQAGVRGLPRHVQARAAVSLRELVHYLIQKKFLPVEMAVSTERKEESYKS